MYKALISFTGAVSMKKGEVKAIADETIAKDLVRCGYVEALEKKEDKPEMPMGAPGMGGMGGMM